MWREGGSRETTTAPLTENILERRGYAAAATLAEPQPKHIEIRQSVLPGENAVEQRVNGRTDD